MRAAALLTGLLLLTAGCLGMGGGESDDASAPSSSDLPESNDPTDPASGNHTHEPKPEPHYVNRTGEVDGTNVVVGASGPANETVAIPATSRVLVINLTAEDGELNGEIYPPDCEDESPNTIGAQCSHDLNTYNSSQDQYTADGGSASWSTEDVSGGNWTVELYKADPGNQAVPYTLTFYYVDLHAPTPGHHS